MCYAYIMNRNSDTLKSFTEFCEIHPDLRFWQALLSWSGYTFISVSQKNVAQETQNNDLVDTYYFEGKKQ
jgi:hypothetical protein